MKTCYLDRDLHREKGAVVVQTLTPSKLRENARQRIEVDRIVSSCPNDSVAGARFYWGHGREELRSEGRAGDMKMFGFHPKFKGEPLEGSK